MSQANNVTILRANHDSATSFVHYWFGEVINDAISLGYNVTDLETDTSRLIPFQQSMQNDDPAIFFGGGHGDAPVFTGQDTEDILWIPNGLPGHSHSDSNVGIVQDRIVYLLSCVTGAGLGPAIGVQDNTFFIGYQDDFIWAGFSPGDLYSQGFMEASNAICAKILQGGTVIEAYNEGGRVFDEWIDYWQQSADPIASQVIGWMIHDRDVMVATGITPKQLATPVFPIVGVIAGVALLGLVALKN